MVLVFEDNWGHQVVAHDKLEAREYIQTAYEDPMKGEPAKALLQVAFTPRWMTAHEALRLVPDPDVWCDLAFYDLDDVWVDMLNSVDIPGFEDVGCEGVYRHIESDWDYSPEDMLKEKR